MCIRDSLDGATLRSMEPDDAVRTVQEVKGLGPFAAELVVIRGANSPDIVPLHERRLEDEITVRYGPDHNLADVSKRCLLYTSRTFRCPLREASA